MSMDDTTIQQAIKKIVLRNAIEYGGSARYDVVISKVVGLRPDLRPTIKEQIPLIRKIVDEVNFLARLNRREWHRNLWFLRMSQRMPNGRKSQTCLHFKEPAWEKS